MSVREEKGLWTLVHGDDYMSAGDADYLDWLEAQLTAQSKIQTSRVGHGLKCSAEGQILNRFIRATDNGFNSRATLVMQSSWWNS